MAELILSLIVALIFGFISITFFPFVHDWINLVDVSDTIPLVQLLVKGIPYFIVFVIVYSCVTIVKKRVNN